MRADLDILKHLFRYLAHFPCLSSYYKADLDTVEQLFRYLATFTLVSNNHSKHVHLEGNVRSDLK